VNESCIEHCRARFGDVQAGCRIHYHVNDGSSLGMLADDSITLGYCWDAMVHFERAVIRRYLVEFRRVLVTGGHAALHFSNYGASCPDPASNWRDNPHWRSTMSKERFELDCADLGLDVLAATLLEWGGIPELDCAALIRKPA